MSSSLILCNNHFSMGLWHAPKSGFYMTTSSTKEAPKHFPKPNFYQKRSQSLFGDLLPVWSTVAFWISTKLLYLVSILSKLMRCTGNCSACSQHWSTEKAQSFSTTVPDHMSYNQRFKSWIGLCGFASSTVFTDLSPTDYLFFKHLEKLVAGKMLPQPTGCIKCFLRVCRIPKHRFLCYRSKQTFLVGNCIDCNGSYFD